MDARKRRKNADINGPANREKPDKPRIGERVWEEDFEETLAEEDISWQTTRKHES